MTDPTPHSGLAPDDLIAYFCMEYGVDERLRIYSGGLGVLAGDHLKAARDGGVPIVAVGLLYRQGYFKQTIDGEGRQHCRYPRADPASLPLRRALDATGRPLCVELVLDGRHTAVGAWAAELPGIRLWLLDTDLADNAAPERAITQRLYGGDREVRLRQELVLGVGGVRLLRALGLRPTAWHVNEGHAAFQLLERCAELTGAGMGFDEAIEASAASTVFTTHTPVPAGHDVFDLEMMERYLRPLLAGRGLDWEEVEGLGEAANQAGRFNMTALGLRGARFCNGVSRVHRGVAARLDRYVWPQVPAAESPIGYVTNGVHLDTWLAPEWKELFDERLGDGWRRRPADPASWEAIEDIEDDLFWRLRGRIRRRAVAALRHAADVRFRRIGLPAADSSELLRYLSPEPDVLLLGFARRFATYKRAALLLSQPQRLAALLTDSRRPVVLLFAGKAHPRDDPGKELIRMLHEESMREPLRDHVLLLEGYDLELARNLVAGADVWLNLPRPPLEASGTSGQKAGANGVLNLSVLDGWWAEGYEDGNGWGVPGSRDDGEEADAADADAVLTLLEEEVVPAFFDRDESGLPRRWIRRSKAAMRSILPRFNTARMLDDYVASLYGPAGRHGARLAANEHGGARELAAWKRRVAAAWPDVRLRAVDGEAGERDASGEITDRAGEAAGDAKQATGRAVAARAVASLAGLDPAEVVVERVVGRRLGGGDAEIVARTVCHVVEVGPEETVFEAAAEDRVSDGGDAAALESRLRIYPRHSLLAHAFETGLMHWDERCMSP